MNVLIGCEESQTVTKSFRKQGHSAYSCDIIATRGNPDWHIKDDIFNAITLLNWDLIILHPPCRYMALSGNRWWANTKERHDAEIWTTSLWDYAITHCNKVAMENPMSTLWKSLRKEHDFKLQWIQPWMFGDPESKTTGFALHNLPFLVPTNIVKPTFQSVWRMAPSKTRSRDRSVTFPGIADALSKQWS
jgi:hypothetical protein